MALRYCAPAAPTLANDGPVGWGEKAEMDKQLRVAMGGH